MSHVTAVKVQIKDLAALKAACKAIGLEFREGQRTYKWYGRWMNDYSAQDAAFQQGIDPKTYGTCDHAIAVPGNKQAYEIGVVNRGDHHAMVWDFWNGGLGLEAAVGHGAERLIEAYTTEVAVNTAKQFATDNGYTYTEELNRETGERELVLRQY